MGGFERTRGPSTPTADSRPHPDTATQTDGRSLRQIARQSGYTGDQCSNCESLRMRIAGHCMVCEECGTTTGCS